MTLLSVLPILVIFASLFFVLGNKLEFSNHNSLKVLTYSAFLNSWGPGPSISQKFEEQTGIKVEFVDAGDANLLLKKLSLFGADVVLGLDQFSISQQNLKWKSEFEAVDWAPLSFIYRKGEVEPPRNLDDLLDKRFEKKLSVSDPRTSTPGLQFLIWIMREKGLDFLKKLKNTIGFVGPSWSASYGYFKKGQSQLVFSYVTSSIYHLTEEKNPNYLAATLTEKLPVQTEYAAIPDSTNMPEAAQLFLEFLKSDEIQKMIMQKNFMLPMKVSVTQATPFKIFQNLFAEQKPDAQPQNIQQLLNQWEEIGF